MHLDTGYISNCIMVVVDRLINVSKLARKSQLICSLTKKKVRRLLMAGGSVAILHMYHRAIKAISKPLPICLKRQGK